MAKRDKENNNESGGLVYSTNSETMRSLLMNSLNLIETLEPKQQKLRVSRDTKKRAGKIVTLVTGFEGKSDDLLELTKRLKSACGVGGSGKDGEIIVQGDHVDKVVTLLLSWGYSNTKRKG